MCYAMRSAPQLFPLPVLNPRGARSPASESGALSLSRRLPSIPQRRRTPFGYPLAMHAPTHTLHTFFSLSLSGCRCVPREMTNPWLPYRWTLWNRSFHLCAICIYFVSKCFKDESVTSKCSLPCHFHRSPRFPSSLPPFLSRFFKFVV